MLDAFSSPTVTNVTFSGNPATTGGGMVNNSSSPTLTRHLQRQLGTIRRRDAQRLQQQPDLNNVVIANSPSGGNCDGDAFATKAPITLPMTQVVA